MPAEQGTQAWRGGALGWATRRGVPGGAVAGGSTAAVEIASTRGAGTAGALAGSRKAACAIVRQTGHNTQSGVCGMGAGAPDPSSSLWQRAVAVATAMSLLAPGMAEPNASCAISAHTASRVPNNGGRRGVIVCGRVTASGGTRQPRHLYQMCLRPPIRLASIHVALQHDRHDPT